MTTPYRRLIVAELCFLHALAQHKTRGQHQVFLFENKNTETPIKTMITMGGKRKVSIQIAEIPMLLEVGKSKESAAAVMRAHVRAVIFMASPP